MDYIQVLHDTDAAIKASRGDEDQRTLSSEGRRDFRYLAALDDHLSQLTVTYTNLSRSLKETQDEILNAKERLKDAARSRKKYRGGN